MRMANKGKPVFDKKKTKETIEKGRRAKWWQRHGAKSQGFFYTDASGKRITDAASLERTSSLVIPPAWKYVRISPHAGSSLQAVGMDTTGRIQYIYNPTYSERQQKKKFAKIEKFGEHLPRLRKITNEDIELEGFPLEARIGHHFADRIQRWQICGRQEHQLLAFVTRRREVALHLVRFARIVQRVHSSVIRHRRAGRAPR